jgi:hypothetical protein
MGSPTLHTEAAQPQQPDMYVHNISTVFGGRAVGREAGKVQEIEARAIWLGHGAVVLSREPDPEFLDYAAPFGITPDILVPSGLDNVDLSLNDGFDDPDLQRAVRGRRVEMYMGDKAWYDFVTAHGGIYCGGDPGDSVDRANDKVEFRRLIAGLAEVPPGVVTSGIEETAGHFYARLAQDGRAIMRLAMSGGGLGNTLIRQPSAKWGLGSSMADIREHLLTRHPSLARPDTRALVEKVLRLKWSPSVAHHTEHGPMSDSLQSTIRTEYVGCISPTPPDVCDEGELAEINNGVLDNLREINFWGYGNTDLGVPKRHWWRRKGKMTAFEENGRTSAAWHATSAGALLLGPWATWRANGSVIISRDHFELKAPATFRELRDELDRHGLLARPGQTEGVMIIIPPAGNIAGLQVHAQRPGRQGYKRADEIFQKLVAVVGDKRGNMEDHPYRP